MSKKLEQVLEYLIANDQEKAKELLHQVFIEKARKIHEELISQDELDEMEHLGGDEGDDLDKELEGIDDRLEEIEDEIEAEETSAMSEDAELVDVVDEPMADDAGVEDSEVGGDEAMDSIEDTIGDLEDAIAELRAEFEKLESGEDAEDDMGMDDEDAEDDMEMDMDDEEAELDDDEEEMDDEDEEAELDDEEADMDAEDAAMDDEEKVDESWLEEDFDDLAEAVELEKVSVTMGGEVGSGKGQGAPADKSKSPIATSQTSRMGAKPIAVDSKHHSGYNKETAPSSKDMGLSNRRKKADAGMSKVSKEGNSSAAINKTASEFGADTVGKNSPLSKSPRK